MPGGVLSTAGVLSQKAQDNLRDSWETQHRGPSNAGRIAVLEQGVTWQQTGMPPEDAQFILRQTRGVVGFFGASSIERLPTEIAITGCVERFKSITFSRCP